MQITDVNDPEAMAEFLAGLRRKRVVGHEWVRHPDGGGRWVMAILIERDTEDTDGFTKDS